ncbi:MAG: hypothetical protein Q8934_18515 [Bacillota bacterium]|nr:hypothetical protein [Bacillota bacterium]
MLKIGLFFNGKLVKEYDNIPESYAQVLCDAIEKLEETRYLHKVKFFNK